jgi:hypothetical protein
VFPDIRLALKMPGTRKRTGLSEPKIFHARMVVTRAEEWWVEADSPEQAEALLSPEKLTVIRSAKCCTSSWMKSWLRKTNSHGAETQSVPDVGRFLRSGHCRPLDEGRAGGGAPGAIFSIRASQKRVKIPTW